MFNLTSRDSNDNIPVSVNEGGTKSIGNVILVSDLFSTSLALRTKECMHRYHASHVTSVIVSEPDPRKIGRRVWEIGWG